jgi:hypothetical protein
MAAVGGGASLSNGSVSNGSHHCWLQWVQQITTTTSQGNYPDDDGAKINGGRCHTSSAKGMFSKQQSQGWWGGGNNLSVFPPAIK